FGNLLSGCLLHFSGCSICVCLHDELRQPFHRVWSILCNLENPIGYGPCFARPGGGDHGEIPVQFANKSLPRCFVGNCSHLASSSSTNAGCVIAHFSASRSISIGSVASGYFLTNPKSA